MKAPETIQCDLAVIGAGMAGMAAAVFAAHRGLSTLQVGRTGEIVLSTGFLDLLGVHPVEEGKVWEDPWAAIDALVQAVPRHPYARLGREEIRSAFKKMIAFLDRAGLRYETKAGGNALVISPLGTVKPTYGVPATMWNGVTALERKFPCLIVDFEGLRGFSSRLIAAGLGDRWPGLRGATIPFPRTGPAGEAYPEHLARALDLSETRERLVDLIQPHLGEARAVGMPAVLGTY
ncbi:MAG: FAD-binding protein, partial [Deltaproteobacteria bacterium]|nr:FAD-binding protein [Deltaproteobacteria bacterium]